MPSPPREEGGEYWCESPLGPYREVQLLLDGEVAGIAAPYPHIYTGGWSNPILWYQIPAPRSFDIKPLRFELTPFIGRLNDGKAHEVRLRVVGAPEDSEGWTLLPNVHLWRDAAAVSTQGEVLLTELEPLAVRNLRNDGTEISALDSRSGRRFLARGRLRTSKGVVETTVERTLTGSLTHHWNADDRHDGVRGEWSDRQDVTRQTGSITAVDSDISHFGFDGAIDTDGDEKTPRLTTSLGIYDEFERRRSENHRILDWRQTSDRFDGQASYTSGASRSSRAPSLSSRQEYLQRDLGGTCYHRTVRTRNGRFVDDSFGCATNPSGMETAPSEE